MLGLIISEKVSITSNIKIYNKNDINIKILENKIIKTMDLEKWISIKRNICIFKSKVVNYFTKF